MLTPKTAESVNKLVATEQYEQAITLYGKIPATEQEKIDIKSLQQAQGKYLNKLLQQAKTLQKKHRFYDAEDTLEQGQKNLPSSSEIQQAIAALNTARTSYNDKYQQQHDTVYANFLAAEAPILEKLLASQGQERSFKKHYQAQAKARLEHAQIIGQQGLTSLDAGFIKTATHQLKLAEQLQSDEQWQSALNAIKKKTYRKRSQKEHKREQQQNRNKRQKAQALADQQAQQQAQVNKLKLSFEKQLSATNIIGAQKILEDIKRKDDKKHETQWIDTHNKKLETLISAQLATDLHQGQSYYSNGLIGKAIDTWKNAQTYAPNNSELKEHIRRAETFQARYKELNAK
ncbi:MAG: hypothetical protein HRU20_28270 [Pseudomonadales bacterium]|nr:hypothetical protein [Pseudomonadales bacterium]